MPKRWLVLIVLWILCILSWFLTLWLGAPLFREIAVAVVNQTVIVKDPSAAFQYALGLSVIFSVLLLIGIVASVVGGGLVWLSLPVPEGREGGVTILTLDDGGSNG